MSLIKIPDSVLDNLRCQCGQYLSKAPINIQNGKSVCSDCIDMQDPTSVAVPQNSHYEALANLFAFPCRFKLQGCRKYIQFNKLETHEAECSYHVYECPVNLHSPCKCNWKGTTSQLCEHYITQHPELYLQAELPKFEIYFDDHEVYRLIKIEDVLLLLQTKSSLENGKVWFSMVCFKQKDSVGLINYAVKLNSGNNNGRIMKLEDANPLPITKIQMIPSLSLDVNIHTLKDFFKQPDFIECQWDISIKEELKLQVKAQQELENQESYEARNEDIKCVNCSFYMVPPIYRCHKGHKTCVDCKGYYNECKTCQDSLLEFTVADDLENIAKSEQHYCRWLKCRKMLNCEELREHEQNCPHRIHKCPQCNIWSGTLQQLIEHLKSVHLEIGVLITPSIGFNSRDGILTYAIAHNEIFKVNTIFTSGMFGSLKITVWYLGSPHFVNCWEYEITKNSQKMPIQFPKKITNNYSCSIIIDNDEDTKNVATSEATSFTFNFPQTAKNPSIQPVFGVLPSNTTTQNSQTVAFGQSSPILQHSKRICANAKIRAAPNAIIKEATLNSDSTNNLQYYTLNILKVTN